MHEMLAYVLLKVEVGAEKKVTAQHSNIGEFKEAYVLFGDYDYITDHRARSSQHPSTRQDSDAQDTQNSRRGEDDNASGSPSRGAVTILWNCLVKGQHPHLGHISPN